MLRSHDRLSSFAWKQCPGWSGIRSPHVHSPAGREAPGPLDPTRLRRATFQTSVCAVLVCRSLPRIKSLAFSERQALMRRCKVRSCALLA